MERTEHSRSCNYDITLHIKPTLFLAMVLILKAPLWLGVFTDLGFLL